MNQGHRKILTSGNLTRHVVGAIFISTFLCACSGGGQGDGLDAREDSHVIDVDHVDAARSDASDNEVTFEDVGVSVDGRDAGFDPAPWQTPLKDCVEHPRWTPSSRMVFDKLPVAEVEPLTKQWARDRYSDSTAEFAQKSQWGDHVGSHNGSSGNVYLNEGESLSFTTLLSLGRIYEASTLWVSVFVDYQQAETRFTRWVDERDGVAETTRAKALRIDDVQDIELIDFELDADQFRVGAAHDIGVMVFFDSSPTNPAHVMRSFARNILYYGGYEFQPLPCFAAPLDVEYNAAEREMGSVISAWRKSFVFTSALLEQDDKWAPVSASSDESLYLSLLGTGPTAIPTAVTLLANGEMIGDPIFIHRNDKSALSVSQRVLVESTFEPGDTATVFAVMWPYPFFPWMDLEGEMIDGVKWRENTVTNTLRLNIEP